MQFECGIVSKRGSFDFVYIKIHFSARNIKVYYIGQEKHLHRHSGLQSLSRNLSFSFTNLRRKHSTRSDLLWQQLQESPIRLMRTRSLVLVNIERCQILIGIINVHLKSFRI